MSNLLSYSFFYTYTLQNVCRKCPYPQCAVLNCFFSLSHCPSVKIMENIIAKSIIRRAERKEKLKLYLFLSILFLYFPRSFNTWRYILYIPEELLSTTVYELHLLYEKHIKYIELQRRELLKYYQRKHQPRRRNKESNVNYKDRDDINLFL